MWGAGRVGVAALVKRSIQLWLWDMREQNAARGDWILSEVRAYGTVCMLGSVELLCSAYNQRNSEALLPCRTCSSCSPYIHAAHAAHTAMQLMQHMQPCSHAAGAALLQHAVSAACAQSCAPP
eukprot:350928-Chlamydomonas_euryale.AAC.8